MKRSIQAVGALVILGITGLLAAGALAGGSSPAGDQYDRCKKYPWKCETTTTTTETTTREEKPPYVPCVPQNPDGSPGGKDGIPGNDDCARDPDPAPPLVIEPEPPTTPTTPEPPPTTTTEEPPVTTTVSEEPPSIVAPKPSKPRPVKPPGVPPSAPPVCRPGQVETKPCGVEGDG